MGIVPVVEPVVVPSSATGIRAGVERKDYIDLLADELTKSTPLPFSYARETSRCFCLRGCLLRPRCPGIRRCTRGSTSSSFQTSRGLGRVRRGAGA